MVGYRSSEQIFNDLKRFETNDPNGLNGAIILIHLGTSPLRTDKFYKRLDELQDFFGKKGYHFCSLNALPIDLHNETQYNPSKF